MIELHQYSYILWGLGIIVLSLKNVYLALFNYDPTIVSLTGMAMAFPWYLITKSLQEVKE